MSVAHATSVGTATMTANVDNSLEALTEQAMEHRETIARNYIPIINPSNNRPMLQLRRHGNCELVDPRACLHPVYGTADAVCGIYVHISEPYWKAMIKAGYIVNKQRVVLRCTEMDTYAFVIAMNFSADDQHQSENVEDMLQKHRNQQGVCRPGVELLTLNYTLKQVHSLAKRRKLGAGSASSMSAQPPGTTTAIMTSIEWSRSIQEAKRLYDCQRKLQTASVAQRAGACSRKQASHDTQSDTTPMLVVPTLVIEAPWGMIADPAAARLRSEPCVLRQ